MNIESLREYCIARKGATESFPFDEETLVFKASGKNLPWLIWMEI